jgi:protein TonB
VNDAVDRVIVEREAMDQGLSAGLVASAFVHAALLAAPIAVSMLLPHQPPIKIIDGFAVQLPRGGQGTPTTEQPAPAAPEPAPTAPPETSPPEPPKPEPPLVKKPPKEEPRKGLPEPDAKNKKGKPEKTPPPKKASGATAGGTGTSTKTPGIEWAPAGIGIPEGTDIAGDWYLASVTQRIWTIWVQQVKTGMAQPAVVSFTIQADGSVSDVDLIQSSGAPLLDLAAKRAVFSAAPFLPIPKNYGTNRITIQGIFKPTT